MEFGGFGVVSGQNPYGHTCRVYFNPNSLDNKGSWRILKDFCSVTMLIMNRYTVTLNMYWCGLRALYCCKTVWKRYMSGYMYMYMYMCNCIFACRTFYRSLMNRIFMQYVKHLSLPPKECRFGHYMVSDVEQVHIEYTYMYMYMYCMHVYAHRVRLLSEPSWNASKTRQNASFNWACDKRNTPNRRKQVHSWCEYIIHVYVYILYVQSTFSQHSFMYMCTSCTCTVIFGI